MKPVPARAYLLECLEWNPTEGTLLWRTRPRQHFGSEEIWKRWNLRFAGTAAFATDDRGYKCGNLNSIMYRAHRVIWKIATDNDPVEIDHIDGNPSNNTLSNLRDVSHAENLRNTKLRTDNTSGHVGVNWDKTRRAWMASVAGDMIGRFKNKEQAISARKTAERNSGFHHNHGRGSVG